MNSVNYENSSNQTKSALFNQVKRYSHNLPDIEEQKYKPKFESSFKKLGYHFKSKHDR